ncbi:serine/threonine-protein kinase [Streptosporangium sp. NPDC003464]
MRVAARLIEGDPQHLGDYRLAGRLGEGCRGVVYEAYDPGGRRVALKVLKGDPELWEGLAREAAAAGRAAPFCTAAVLDAGHAGPRPYVVSEYAEGPSLRRAGRIFAGGDLLGLATAIATALTALHGAGVVHGDLTPDNVLLGPGGPRVIDFGLARTPAMSLTSGRLGTGAPAYAAPESFTGEGTGAPADVFAWGATVLYAATGEDPFAAPTLDAVMRRILQAGPDLSPLPGTLRDLAAAALARDPRARPTARELLTALVAGESRAEPPVRCVGEVTPGAVRGDHGSPGAAHVAADPLLVTGGDVAARLRTACDDPGLGTLAEDAYAALDPAERELVREVFLRFVVLPAGGGLVTRGVRAPRAGVETRVVEAFGCLVVRRGGEVALAHPALPYAWPRLREWIEADRHRLMARGGRVRRALLVLIVLVVSALAIAVAVFGVAVFGVAA